MSDYFRGFIVSPLNLIVAPVLSRDVHRPRFFFFLLSLLLSGSRASKRRRRRIRDGINFVMVVERRVYRVPCNNGIPVMFVRSCFDRFRTCGTRRGFSPQAIGGWIIFSVRYRPPRVSFFALVDEQQKKKVDLFRAVQHYTTNTVSRERNNAP